MTFAQVPFLLDRVDRTRVAATSGLDIDGRGAKGQFLTPANVAALLAKMFQDLPSRVRLLDAGAGVGSLTAAFVESCLQREARPRSIDVVAYELEPALFQQLSGTLSLCMEACAARGVVFTPEAIDNDFIESAVLAAQPGLFDEQPTKLFDCAILNPPYKKIRSTSRHRSLLRQVGIETSNLYTAFVALAVKLLRPGGQLVAITPRSFCNGPYFRPFREFLLSECALTNIHLFDSRSSAFRDDAVLQENVIFRVIKGAAQEEVEISSSHGPDDAPEIKRVHASEVIRPADVESFIRVTLSEQHERASAVMSCLSATLPELGLHVSTGRVVDFRARNYLRADPNSSTVPLVYPSHIESGFIEWPAPGAKKPNAIVSAAETQSLLVPRGTYVLTKRFTSKEERRRVVAAVYDPGRVFDGAVGFENHLNYFHANGRGLPRLLALGLWLYLNSTIVDQYFRQFSGHTQVNATDLRSLKYPDRSQLHSIGRRAGEGLPAQEIVDEIVEGVIAT